MKGLRTQQTHSTRSAASRGAQCRDSRRGRNRGERADIEVFTVLRESHQLERDEESLLVKESSAGWVGQLPNLMQNTKG